VLDWYLPQMLLAFCEQKKMCPILMVDIVPNVDVVTSKGFVLKFCSNMIMVIDL